MADGSDDKDDRAGRRLREVIAQRDERQRRWDAGEYQAAAYEAAERLTQDVQPPKGYEDSWATHVATEVRTYLRQHQDDNTDKIVAALQPKLDHEARDLEDFPKKLRQLAGSPDTLKALTRPNPILRPEASLPPYDYIRENIAAARPPRHTSASPCPSWSRRCPASSRAWRSAASVSSTLCGPS